MTQRTADLDPFNNPLAFCRYTAAYIAHPTTIRQRCLEHFDRAPPLSEIEKFRKAHERSVNKYKAWAERRGVQA